MRSHYNTIYLSPHLDDATLSCGGQIYEQSRRGEAVLIVTTMAGDAGSAISSYAQSLQERWELPQDAAAGRRAEDVAAAAILGADVHHWDIPDCIYRTDPATGADLYLSDDEIFGEVAAAEGYLIDLLVDLLNTLPPADRMIAPLTVGHHVDHLLVRTAAERVCGDQLLYYEDYPYAQEGDKLEKALGAEIEELQSLVVPVGEAAIHAKIEAILAYRSQMSTFWDDRADLEGQIRAYTETVGGERLWSVGRVTE
jgi:LmbE family N-acetylglucosaminyl deacetylase